MADNVKISELGSATIDSTTYIVGYSTSGGTNTTYRYPIASYVSGLLASYVTTSGLYSQLSGYVTSSGLSSTLSSYAKKTDIAALEVIVKEDGSLSEAYTDIVAQLSANKAVLITYTTDECAIGHAYAHKVVDVDSGDELVFAEIAMIGNSGSEVSCWVRLYIGSDDMAVVQQYDDWATQLDGLANLLATI